MTTPAVSGGGGIPAPPPPPPSLPQMSSALPPSQKCAIVECPNPRYVDPSGTVHECCGITHAMEHQRRLALMQRKSTYLVFMRIVYPSRLFLATICGRNKHLIIATDLISCGAIIELMLEGVWCGEFLFPGLPKYLDVLCRYDLLWIILSFSNTYTVETNQQVVKGVTHCYLPECNLPTWPFMNYCGRTHAQQGKQRNLPRKKFLSL